MFWKKFFSPGIESPFWVEEKVTGTFYDEIIKYIMLPFYSSKTAIQSTVLKNKFVECMINVMERPPQTPDSNTNINLVGRS